MESKAPTRGRPKSEEKKHQIFEAAVTLFLDKGFDGTSMDEIAECACVSKQTVYSHFRSKEELFAYCIAEKCVSYELSSEFMDLERPVREMLSKIGHKFSAMLLSDEAIRVKRLLCASAEQSPRLSQLFYEAGPRHMIDLLSGYLAAQAARGRLLIDDSRVAACQFLYMLHGEAHFCALINVPGAPGREQISRYTDQCVETFMRAYGVK